jgi:hypothetical protein
MPARCAQPNGRLASSGSFPADLGTMEPAVVRYLGDIIGRPGRVVNRRSANLGFWDVASIVLRRDRSARDGGADLRLQAVE